MKLPKYIIAIFLNCCLLGCEDFVDLDSPDHKIIAAVVFASDETAISAMTGIYNQLFTATFSGGWMDSVTVITGLCADELHYTRTSNLEYMEFENNEISPTNPVNLNIWSSAYNMIYMVNSLLEGLENSMGISNDIRYQLEGEAKFIRAFTYFYLINLYGEVPLLLSTDYRVNSIAQRNTENEVYQQISMDLQDAMSLLEGAYRGGDRTHVNRFAAISLLARVNLYQKNWQQAENLSNQIIANSDTYQLLDDLDQVFLANSREAIWQISPIGSGSRSSQTNEGNVFIIDPIFSFFANLKLSENIVGIFQPQDNRLINWVGYHSSSNAFYAYKYKIWNSTEKITEYSMVLRLAEQYLIRSEARAMQGNSKGAIDDLDKIRGRAGLEGIGITYPGINGDEVLKIIKDERRRELFTEWGHRWFDLRRTGKINDVLGTIKVNWNETDVVFPIPEQERMKNPNLGQNNGY